MVRWCNLSRNFCKIFGFLASQSCLGALLLLLLAIMFYEIFKTSSDRKQERQTYGSAHANRIASSRNELQTFLVDTTHAHGHSTFTQQVMQMLSVQVNSYNYNLSEWGGGGGNLADLASQQKV